jgi:parallel beta-helix repeat protein
VVLESGDTIPEAFTGTGVLTRGVDSVVITGGRISGYRHGVRVEGGRGHRIAGADLSGSRRQRLRSTAEQFDEADWLDIFRPDTFETYGGGLLVKWADGVTVTGVKANGAQNGIGLIGTRGSYLADNDVSHNSGWGIHLWASTRNVIVRNRASHNLRCAWPAWSRGCDSAALLLRESSDSNYVAENDLSHSGDGFFLSGHRPDVKPSQGNVVIRNDGSHARHNAFEATFSWGNLFLENRADSSDYGFWLGYSTGTVVRGNIVVGSRTAGIAIEHGSDNSLASNVIIGGGTGIRLFAPTAGGEQSRGYAVDDNVLANLDRGLVLERTTQARVRGNLFDGVGTGLVADEVSAAAVVSGNVFLRARDWYVDAPSLAAGGNFWGTGTEPETAARVRGKVTLEPWKPASEAGY